MVITIIYPSIANYVYLGMQCIWPHVYLLLTVFIRDIYICILVRSDISIHGFANYNNPSILALLSMWLTASLVAIYNKVYNIAEVTGT